MMISGKDGAAIAQKLGASKPRNGRHKRFRFRVEGVHYDYGVSHDANKENQAHIAHELGISIAQAKQLAICQMSPEKFVQIRRIQPS